MAALAVLLLVGNERTGPAVSNSINHLLADTNCRQVPTFVAPPSLKVKSVLLAPYIDHDKGRDFAQLPLAVLAGAAGVGDDEYMSGGGYQMVSHALQRGLRFVEIESPGRYGKAMSDFLELGGDRQWKYLKASLASRGDPACEGFERAAKALGSEMWLASVPPGKCVATFPESSAKSDYELRIVDLPDDRWFKPQASEQPAAWQILDRRNGTIYAQMQRRMNIYSRCPSVEVRQKFLDLLQPSLKDDST